MRKGNFEPTVFLENVSPVCAICFDNQCDFLFIPYADQILEKQLHCPIYRASITEKQRVLDV